MAKENTELPFECGPVAFVQVGCEAFAEEVAGHLSRQFAGRRGGAALADVVEETAPDGVDPGLKAVVGWEVRRWRQCVETVATGGATQNMERNPPR